MRAGNHRQAVKKSRRMLMLSHFHLYGELKSSGVMGRRNGLLGLREDDDDLFISSSSSSSSSSCSLIKTMANRIVTIGKTANEMLTYLDWFIYCFITHGTYTSYVCCRLAMHRMCFQCQISISQRCNLQRCDIDIWHWKHILWRVCSRRKMYMLQWLVWRPATLLLSP